MQEDSLGKRYLYKLNTNLAGLFFNLVMQMIIPRGLGVKAYGDFNFLTNFFQQIIAFLDTGTSTCFYTQLSKRQQDNRLIGFYIYFSLLVCAIMLLFIPIAQVLGLDQELWAGQSRVYVFMAAVFAGVYWLAQVAAKINDALGVTVEAERGKLLQKVIIFLVLLAIYFAGRLSLFSYFIFTYFSYILLLLLLVVIVHKKRACFAGAFILDRGKIVSESKVFFSYSHPLIIYAVFGLFTGVFDRWTLQTYSGSIQQGYYSLSYQIGFACFLFTSAMTPLIMREFSIAHDNKDIAYMKHLFRRYIPLLYMIAAYFCCFVAVNARDIIMIFGGKEYLGAMATVTVMAFYPIHQTYGQLSGSVFFAVGNTSRYRDIGVFFGVLGIPVVWLLLAPSSMYGLGLGSFGLAVKMVLLQFFAVNVQAFFNARLLGLNYYKLFLHQLLVVFIFCLIAILVKIVAVFCFHFILCFLIKGFLYTMVIAVLIYCFPIFAGLDRGQLAAYFKVRRGKMI